MKNTIISIASIFIVALLAFLSGITLTDSNKKETITIKEKSAKNIPHYSLFSHHLPNPEERKPQISVEASSVVYANPDLATITFGVETHDENIRNAQKNNSAKMQKIISNLNQLGIPTNKIQTSDFNLDINYEEAKYYSGFWKEKIIPKVLFYGVKNNIIVRVEDENIKNIDEIINQSIENGANTISSIEFTLKDFAPLRKKAYKKATEMVRQRANYIAEGMNVKLGKLMHINPSHSDYQNYSWQSRSQNVMQNVSFDSNSGGSADSGSISGGQVQVRVNLSVSYEIEQ